MRRFGIHLLLMLALVCGCASPARNQVARADSTPTAYARIAHPNTNVIQLETALREFAPRGKSGPTIWLASVVHVGEPDYYHLLQAHFELQQRVLYEGVSPDASALPPNKSAGGSDDAHERCRCAWRNRSGWFFNSKRLITAAPIS